MSHCFLPGKEEDFSSDPAFSVKVVCTDAFREDTGCRSVWLSRPPKHITCLKGSCTIPPPICWVFKRSLFYFLQRITSQTCDQPRPFFSAAWCGSPLTTLLQFHTQLTHLLILYFQPNVRFHMSVCEELCKKHFGQRTFYNFLFLLLARGWSFLSQLPQYLQAN